MTSLPRASSPSQHPWITPSCISPAFGAVSCGRCWLGPASWLLFLSIAFSWVESTRFTLSKHIKPLFCELQDGSTILLWEFLKVCAFSSLTPTTVNSELVLSSWAVCTLYASTHRGGMLTPHYSRKPDPTRDPYLWLGCLGVQLKWHMRTNNRSPVDIPMALCLIPNLIG